MIASPAQIKRVKIGDELFPQSTRNDSVKARLLCQLTQIVPRIKFIGDQSHVGGSASYAGTQYDVLTRKMITAQQASKGNSASQSRYEGLAAYYASNPTRRASGGTTMSSEMTMVGENGPEVVALPGGAKVYPSGTGPSGGGGGNVTFNVTIQAALADPNMIAKTLVTVVTNAARAGQIPKNAFSSALTGH